MKDFAEERMRHVFEEGQNFEEEDEVFVVCVEFKAVQRGCLPMNAIKSVHDSTGRFIQDGPTDLLFVETYGCDRRLGVALLLVGLSQVLHAYLDKCTALCKIEHVGVQT